ncbi:MAG TPA: hypothetical protein VK205_00580 [Prolixibacteraceae bacterium]|jgi:hypothetical protein|nr:hypothetical protein [Prolixibacteraceae bacterium]
MGTLKQGNLGGFSGKVGTVIGFTRNGISYIRGLMTQFNFPIVNSASLFNTTFFHGI